MKAKKEINVKITPLINSSNIGKIEAEKELKRLQTDYENICRYRLCSYGRQC